MPTAPATPFPPRTTGTVRVDSVVEERAYVGAYPPADGPWQVVSQVLVKAGERSEDHLTLRSAAGRETVVRFDVTSFVGTGGLERGGVSTIEWFDRVLRSAAEFARANGPHHPGELPRFPVPSERYPGSVEGPLAILAVDDAGRRGLYAPTRVVVLAYPSGEPTGAGDYPGFDPASWPPRRLGDWPPAAVRALDPLRLQATLARFGACWVRLLDAWFAGGDYPQRADEATEARALLSRLDPPAMTEVYERLSPRFWRWLAE